MGKHSAWHSAKTREDFVMADYGMTDPLTDTQIRPISAHYNGVLWDELWAEDYDKPWVLFYSVYSQARQAKHSAYTS